MVEMGTDRIHHALWDNMDPAHRFYEAGNKFENAIHDYYKEVDREIGELLKFADAKTDVLVVSDHGAKRMDGGICVNEWLMANGYLALKEQPQSAVPLSKVKIDWPRTKAWGDGGYYARVFLNVAGREPEGTIAPEDYEKVRDELIAGLKVDPGRKRARYRHAGFPPGGALQGGARRGAGSDRLFRRSLLALSRHGWRRKTPHFRE